MQQAPTVCAVVVTFNRKTLLQRTLTALYQQTQPVDKVLVVDNASTDGTYQMLQEKGFLAMPNLEYINLQTNTGGAGGFYNGVKLGYEQDFDWLWLMDDDGYPTEDCLEKLLAYKEDFDFYGPLVLDDKMTGNLSFPFFYRGEKVLNKDKATTIATDNIIHNHISPFNGILLSKRLIEVIEYPQSNFFIWGDEMNYCHRAKKSNARIATIANIEFYHPTAINIATPMLFKRMQFNDSDSKIKLYCLCRNNTYNLKEYKSSLHAVLFIAKVTWFYTFTKPSIIKLKFCIPALYHGWRQDFRHHRQFIGKSF